MAISCTFANAENTQVVFTDANGGKQTVPIDWAGQFRMGAIDGGGIVGFIAIGGVIAPYLEPPAQDTRSDEEIALAKALSDISDLTARIAALENAP